jgi:hypothetical protein
VRAYIGVSLVLGRLCPLRAHGQSPAQRENKEGERIQRRSYEMDEEEHKRVKHR